VDGSDYQVMVLAAASAIRPENDAKT